MADALDAQTVGQYQLPVVGFRCARCNRNADVDIALVRKRFGAGVTLLEVARQLAADGGRCALAAEGFDNICGARPYEPDVTVWATLSHAKFGGWGARLRCRRHMAALKTVKPCPEVIDLDPVQLIASHGHDQRLDRLPAKLVCPGCGTDLISIEWIVPKSPPPAGGQAAAPVLQLRPGRASVGRKRFRVIGGGSA